MSWKVKLEKKIKEDIFRSKFKTSKDVMDYLEKYLESYFDVEEVEGFIVISRTGDNLSLEMYNYKLSIDDNKQKIIFSKSVEGHHQSIGNLRMSDLKYESYISNGVFKDFTESIIEDIIQSVFSPLVAARVFTFK